MKTYTALEVAQMIKEDEVIYIGYLNYRGNEVVNNNGVQKWSGKAVEYFKNKSASKCDIQFVKCEDGYESLFVYELRKAC